MIAPGTGLGEAFLIWEGEWYRAYPSEGGHADFGPTNPLEIDLLRYLHKKMEHMSYERTCSGHGLPDIYGYLKETGHAEEQDSLDTRLGDRTVYGELHEQGTFFRAGIEDTCSCDL